MAARYWVGTGTWDTTSTTNWSATNGGAGGASVPTIADDVFFTSLSGSMTTGSGFLNAQSITCTGYSGTWSGTSALFIIHGSLTLATGMTYSLTNESYIFRATGSINTAGKTINAITVDGGTGYTPTITLASALTTTGTIGPNGAGAIFTTANFSISAASNIRALNGATINLGSSQVTFTGNNPSFSLDAASTLNAGTSTITFTQNGVISSPGKTYNNVAVTANSAGSLIITGGNTFSTLTLTAATGSPKTIIIYIDSDQTIGTLVTSGTTINNRIAIVGSNTTFTKRPITLTVGTYTTKSDVDFGNITAAGASAPWSGTRLGDLGGNSNISFQAAKTVYWNSSSLTNFTDAGWATTSGGTPAAANFPLPQDSIVIDDAGAATSITGTNHFVKNVTTSSRTTAITFNPNLVVLGNWTTGSGVSFGSGYIMFGGTGVQTFSSAGKTLPTGGSFHVLWGATCRLQDALSSSGIVYVRGDGSTFDMNGYAVTAPSAITQGAAVLAFGSGSIMTLTGTSTVFQASQTGVTTTGSGTISVTGAAAKTFSGNGGNYSAVTLNQGGAGALTILGSNSFANIASSYGATGNTSIRFNAGTTTTVSSFTASGTAGKLLTLTSTSTTRAILSDSSGTNSISFANISNLNATGGANWWSYSVNGNTDGGNNLGWLFVPAMNTNFFAFF